MINIDSGNNLAPVWRQPIIPVDADLFVIWTLLNVCETSVKSLSNYKDFQPKNAFEYIVRKTMAILSQGGNAFTQWGKIFAIKSI